MSTELSNARPARGHEELKTAAEHASYEVEGIYHALTLWPFLPPLHPWFRNMAIESFLVHYRNLRDFLCPPRETKRPDLKRRDYQQALDSVIADDFFRDAVWDCDRDSWKEVVDGEKDLINKQLSHLSYSRTHGQPWPIEDMGRMMLQRFAEFLQRLPDDTRPLFLGLKRIFPSVKWQ